jgi:hypothetical protein
VSVLCQGLILCQGCVQPVQPIKARPAQASESHGASWRVSGNKDFFFGRPSGRGVGLGGAMRKRRRQRKGGFQTKGNILRNLLLGFTQLNPRRLRRSNQALTRPAIF